MRMDTLEIANPLGPPLGRRWGSRVAAGDPYRNLARRSAGRNQCRTDGAGDRIQQWVSSSGNAQDDLAVDVPALAQVLRLRRLIQREHPAHFGMDFSRRDELADLGQLARVRFDHDM